MCWLKKHLLDSRAQYVPVCFNRNISYNYYNFQLYYYQYNTLSTILAWFIENLLLQPMEHLSFKEDSYYVLKTKYLHKTI